MPNGDGKSGKRDGSRGRETEDSYIGRSGERGGGPKGGIFEREKKKERRLGVKERTRGKGSKGSGAKDREREEGKENDQGTQRALVLLTGR